MNYNRYTNQSPLVSEIGFGGWQLGVNSGWKGVTEAKAIDMVRKALDFGVNFYDTAPNYGNGTGEIRLGKALKSHDRSKIVINTKFGHTDRGDLNFDANSIQESLEGSLKRLQVDYVDSLIIHNPPMEYLDGKKNAHYEILERLKEEGKIKAYGASLDSYNEMKLFMETTNCEVIEAFFNILHQDAARAFDLAQQKGVGIIVKIPLDSGWLSGKYNENSTFTDIRARWSLSDIHTRAALVKRIKKIINSKDNLAQSALSFCLAYEAVSTVIPGNTTLDQLVKNLDSVNKPLSSEIISELENFYQNDVKELKLPW